MQARSRPDPEPREEPQERHRPDRHDDEQRCADDPCLDRRCPCEADGQEEADEEEVLEAQQGVRELTGPRVAGQEQTSHERPEVGLQAHRIEDPRADRHGQGDAEEDEDLAMPGTVEQPPRDRTQHEEARDEEERPRRRPPIAGRHEEGHGEEVLEHEHPDRQAPREGFRFVGPLECLDGEHGRGEGERESDDRSRPEVELGGERESDHTGDQEDAAIDDGRSEAEDGRGHPHAWTREAADLELQPHTEQQEEHTEVRDPVDGLRGLDAERVEHESGDEVADQRRQLHGPRGEAEPERGEEQGYLHGLPLSSHPRPQRNGVPSIGQAAGAIT